MQKKGIQLDKSSQSKTLDEFLRIKLQKVLYDPKRKFPSPVPEGNDPQSQNPPLMEVTDPLPFLFSEIDIGALLCWGDASRGQQILKPRSAPFDGQDY